jgi:hypothetical protein
MDKMPNAAHVFDPKNNIREAMRRIKETLAKLK